MKLLICAILAYLIGSFPTAYLVGKIFFHKNIFDYGSGNVGTTNAYRVFGKYAGTVVLIIDILKGTLGALMPLFFNLDRHWVLFIGIFAVIGHCFSIFLKFRGGKAVATSAGILLAYNPLLFLICFIVLATIVYVTSMVSVASLTTVLFFTIASLFLHDWILTIVAAIVTIIIYVRHIPNIKRLLKGKENLVPIGLKYKKQQREQQK
ncbi:glycerol-3-phosphate 1-O-acyltransferase PlsY [Companilactobacillus alimentarius]|uniref:Glycerol-3-phosphate acyltransferase n=1 Tax=Companilactobacillus alimentarius DSM 20249 TaxID=1423720 RepID=A0A2K9HEZ5_9LACO|nr:glycerol-3-phosphate 1-O-acyltransferase PlsY [Companilactobacillus alimentarius]AUI71141.1 acyl-phosphate glycerol 3-phosphate acyltransferase [Companilactobacillus alimentarius DSM 20249]MDT6951594.1 glycerol-3-phosphate 1-O-acyltransferase PlsY [Companilactobacillus alimentarius]GEO43953.1 glycerol-3-phosphate acyltransferase [Companilactobacillus alimentarius]